MSRSIDVAMKRPACKNETPRLRSAGASPASDRFLATGTVRGEGARRAGEAQQSLVLL